MCVMCSSRSDSDLLSAYDDHTAGDGADYHSAGSSTATVPASAASGLVTYSWDQIARYLTEGYWDYRGEASRAFILDASRTLTYDASRLSDVTRMIAERAFDIWGAATGITFRAAGSAGAAVTETSDAGANIRTAMAVGANSEISATLSAAGDVDYFRVSFVAGKTYLISMNGAEGSAINSVLQVMGADGSQLAYRNASSATTGAEFISFTATTSGSYYLVASDYGNDSAGGYTLSVQAAADITFSELDTGARTWTERSGEVVNNAYINVADTWANLHLNGNMLQTYVHEIGHALGLGHAGPYNFDAQWGVSNAYANDSWSSSVMSYFDQSENPNDAGSHGWLMSLMPADLIAIQTLYGAGSQGSETADTVWGPGGNLQDETFQHILDMWARIEPADRSIYVRNNFSFMVYDTAGNDTLDFSAFSQNQRIDLNELARSDVGGLSGNLVIARGTVIENAAGGAGNDLLAGNAVNNILTGGAGNDVLQGGSGKDHLYGGAGNDMLTGGDHADFFVFSGGRDVITDFTDNVDTLLIDTAIWGGAAHSLAEILSSAVRVDGGIRFDLAAGHSVELRGITDLAALADDLILI